MKLIAFRWFNTDQTRGGKETDQRNWWQRNWSCKIVISKRCQKTLTEDKKKLQDELHDSEIYDTELFQYVSKERLNSKLSDVGVSSFKTLAISSHLIMSYGKKKL